MTKVTPAHWNTEAPDPEEWRRRIAAKSARDDVTGCIVFTGRLDRYGYGIFIISQNPRRRQTGAHRAAWLAERGPIPLGMMLDHLCRNRACVNVDHMEVVTAKVNTKRGLAGTWVRPLKTHCKYGHEFTPENTAIRRTDRRGGTGVTRQCLSCRRGAARVRAVRKAA